MEGHLLDLSRPIIDEQAIEKNIKTEKPVYHDGGQQLTGFNQAKKTNYFSIFSIIILAIFVIMTAGLYLLKLSRTSTLKNIQEGVARLEQQLSGAELKATNKQVESLTKGIEQANKIFSSRVSYKTLLEDFNKTVPNGITLTSLKTDEKNILKVEGEAENNEAIANFLTNINASTQFSVTDLTNLSQTEVSSNTTDGNQSTSSVIKFSFEGTIKTKTVAASPTPTTVTTTKTTE